MRSDVQQWIHEQTRAGCTPESLLKALLEAGWQPDAAQQVLTQTLLAGESESGTDEPKDEVNHGPRTATPQLWPADAPVPLRLDGGDRWVDVITSLKHPRVVVLGNVLAPDECEALMAAAQSRMKRSLTVQTQTGGEAVNEARTSSGMFFQRGETEVVARLEARIARLLHWPLENGEGLQVLHYAPGAEYKPHYDYFDPNEPGTPRILKRGGQRVGTLVMYLNEPEQGGGTTFPDAGLEVMPRRGGAVFFSYDRPHPSTGTLHGGAPVLAGEKWVATKWLREAVFV